MDMDVKADSYRQQQAAQTRARIADAARRLFGTNGYNATSIAAIASEAGVAVRTVYAVYGTKREIISTICERWLADAGAHDLASAVLAEPVGRKRLRAAASWLTNLYDAGFDVVLILDAAMDSDADTRELLRAKLAGRNQVMDMMIASLHDATDGDSTVPVERLQTVFRAYAAPGVYDELVIQSHWSPEEFTDFVADALERIAFD